LISYSQCEGQGEILDDLLAYTNKRLEVAMKRAEELGIDIALESDDEEIAMQ
jgi:hypothetical protein